MIDDGLQVNDVPGHDARSYLPERTGYNPERSPSKFASNDYGLSGGSSWQAFLG
jgi:hypothetical protein